MPYPPPSPPYVGPPKFYGPATNKPIERIVLHGTVSPTEPGGARDIAAYFKRTNTPSSCHYITDPGETVQLTYDSIVAYHDGMNINSIGVEMCDWVAANNGTGGPAPLARWNDKPHRDMLARTARLCAELCLAYDVPPVMRNPKGLRAGKRGMCEHDDMSRAFGQSTHWDLGEFPRRRFARMVRAEIDAIKSPTKPPTRVSRARVLLDDALDKATAKRKSRRVRKLQAALETLPRR